MPWIETQRANRSVLSRWWVTSDETTPWIKVLDMPPTDMLRIEDAPSAHDLVPTRTCYYHATERRFINGAFVNVKVYREREETT